jgi:hypothetical protein
MKERYLGYVTLFGDEGARTREKRAAEPAATQAIERILENCFDAYSLSMRKAVN